MKKTKEFISFRTQKVTVFYYHNDFMFLDGFNKMILAETTEKLNVWKKKN